MEFLFLLLLLVFWPLSSFILLKFHKVKYQKETKNNDIQYGNLNQKDAKKRAYQTCILIGGLLSVILTYLLRSMEILPIHG
jgi:hypothetical protein